MRETKDLVARLEGLRCAGAEELAWEAAAEIVRLREALRDIPKQWPDSFAARHARAALAHPK